MAKLPPKVSPAVLLLASLGAAVVAGGLLVLLISFPTGPVVEPLKATGQTVTAQPAKDASRTPDAEERVPSLTLVPADQQQAIITVVPDPDRKFPTIRYTSEDARTAQDSISFKVNERTLVKLADLEGMKANQVCFRPDDTRWACGLAARAALTNLLIKQDIICELTEPRNADTITARCRTGEGMNINAAMVAQGFASPVEAERQRYLKAVEESCKLPVTGLRRDRCPG